MTGSELWLISAGGEARLVARDERGINTPRWSPSGRRIAYVHDFQFGGDHVSDLVVIDSTSGKNVTTIPIAEERGFNDVLQLGWRGGEKRLDGGTHHAVFGDLLRMGRRHRESIE